MLKNCTILSSAKQPSHPAAWSQKSDQVGDHHIRKINDTKNAISHELLGLEQNFKKENSWFCMLQAVAAINKKYINFEFFSAVSIKVVAKFT